MGTIVAAESNGNSKAKLQGSPTPWQILISSGSDKWKFIFENELYTDLRILVGPTQSVFNSHRIILILHSPVFETMLSSRWSGSSGDQCQELFLPEDDPKLFSLLLRTFYTDNLCGTEEVEDLLSLLLLAKKYICPSVSSKCVNALKSCLKESNVLKIYEEAGGLDEPELEKAAENFILSKANTLAGMGEFSKLSKTALSHFISHDELNIEEAELFNAVYRWGEAECGRVDLDPMTPGSITAVLADILPLIRFPLMTPEEFSTQVVAKDILTLAETVQVYKFLTTPEKPKDGASDQESEAATFKFNINPRSRKIFSYVFKRLKGHGFDFGRKWQNFCFKVNRNIKLVSVGLFRSVSPDVEVEIGVKVTDFDLESVYGQIEEKMKCPDGVGGEDVFHVKFPTPVKISKDVVYTISYMIKGKETFYKAGEPRRVDLICQADTLTWEFLEAKIDTDMDQIPEMCFQLQ